MSTTKASSFRITSEKQESLVKLGILVLAAILCEFHLRIFFWADFDQTFQPSRHVSSPFSASRA